jgi:Zn-finger nucleic acid-binding protein
LIKCPVCESVRVVIVLSPARKAFCVKCSSRWIQEGSLQRAVRFGKSHAGAVAAPTLTEPTA